MEATFETIVIFNAKSKDVKSIYEAEVKKFQDLLQSWCTIKKVKTDKMGEKNLSYELKGYKTGWYAVFTYKCNETHIGELERQLRIDDHVLKFLTVKSDELEDSLEDYFPEEMESENVESEQSSAAKVHPVDIFDMIFGIEEEVV